MKIPSTRTVRLQQRDATIAVLQELRSDWTSLLSQIPQEIFDVIGTEALEENISADEAKEIREDMRRERELFVKAQNAYRAYFSTDFEMP